MKLYHITHKSNVKSILKNGLIPSFSSGLSVTKRSKKKLVWLTDNPEFIISSQYDQNRVNDLRIIEVNIDGLLVGARAVYPTGRMSICNHEFFTVGKISPKRLKKVC